VGKSDRAELAVRNSAKECDDTLIVAAQSAEYLRLLDVLIAKAAHTVVDMGRSPSIKIGNESTVPSCHTGSKGSCKFTDATTERVLVMRMGSYRAADPSAWA
jgi:hypothetical protein